MEKEIYSNPGAIGLTGLAIGCFALGPVLLGWYKAGTNPLLTIVPWAIMAGGVCQLLAGYVDLRNRNILGGTAFFIYGVLWVCLGITWLMEGLGIPIDPKTSGWIDVMYLLFSLYLTVGFAKAPKAVFFILVGIDIAFMSLAITKLGIANLKALAGWTIFLLGFLSIYSAAGICINTVYGKEIFPLGKPFVS